MNKILFVLFSFFIASALGQDEKSIENLKQRLTKENDRERIETYLDISDLSIPPDTALIYLKKALVVSNKIGYDSIYPIQFAIARSFYFKGNYPKAKKEIFKGLKSYKYTKNPNGTYGQINMLLGIFNEALNEIDSATFYYNKVISRLKDDSSTKAIEVLSATYTNNANIYLKEGNYEKAIQMYFNSEKKSESIGDKRNQLISLYNAASCFKNLKQYDKAMKYYQKSLQLSKEKKDLKYEGAANVGIGEIYYLKNDFDKALTHLYLAENILKTTEFNSVLHQSYEVLAKVYLKKEDLVKARLYSNKSLKGIESVQDIFAKVDILLTNARIEVKNKNDNEALKSVEKALLISKRNGFLDSEKECVLIKIEILKRQNKLNQLPQLYDELLVIKDSILNTENLKSINELETKYQTEKKEKENLVLKAENVQKELELEKENQQKWFFGVLALLALLTIITIVFYAKNRRQKLLYNSQLNIAKAKQMEHQRIATDLHDYKVKTLEGIKVALEKEGKKTLANKVDIIKESLRSLSKELSQVSFEESEFNEQIITLLASYNSEEFSISHKGLSAIKWKAINTVIKQNLFLVIREGISNAYNHSQASRVDLEFQKNGNQLQIAITDNGKGFEDVTPGIGFTNMKLRINEINGKIKIESKKEAGTQIGIYLALV